MKVNIKKKRKNIMTNWKEFYPNAQKSIKEDINNHILNQNINKIIKYLCNGEIILVSPSSVIDVISGERIAASTYIYTDGEYSWSNALSYYVEKYNLKLPEEFENKILNHNYDI